MTIKEVENLTGISSRSIRFYEEKGLLSVKREKGNNYRFYTEEEIQKLKLIKLLRYLDFSIEEIFAIISNDNLQEALKNKIDALEVQKIAFNEKQNMCHALFKDTLHNELDQKLDHYHQAIAYMETDDYRQTSFDLIKRLCPSLSAVLIQTLIYAAPIAALFINITNQKTERLLVNAILALLAMLMLVLEWSYYFRYHKQFQSIGKQRNKNNFLAIPILIFSILITLTVFLLFHYFITLMAPKDYLFYEVSLISAKFMIGVTVIIIIIIFALLTKKFQIKAAEDITIFYESVWKKFKYLITIGLLVITYCFFTSVTFVTKDQIIYYDPLHPLGITYAYHDVSEIETGFGTQNFAILDYNKKGQFYYRIKFKDKQITFMTPTVNQEIEKYREDTYLELEEFDEQLMQYDIKKISNDECASYCDLDAVYCDRFERIINHKKEL